MLYVGEFGYNEYYSRTLAQLENPNQNALLNGNNLSNLPDLQVGIPSYTTSCDHGAVYLGSNVTNPIYCKQVCGDDGHIIQISKDTTHFINGIKLTEGSWCVTHDPIECNSTTGYVLAGSNGVTCRSRFPEIVGGPKANKIEACNDNIVNATNSILMDRLHNEPVTLNTIITDVDEKLENGHFRFECDVGRDKHGNKYLIHPEARFHVMPDPCKVSGAKMHDSVGAKITSDGWYCDCGKFEETRVANVNPNNTKSACSSCLLTKEGDKINVPYQCATGDSDFDLMGVVAFCDPAKFVAKGAECSTTQLQMIQVNDVYDMPFNGTQLKKEKMDSQEIEVTWP